MCFYIIQTYKALIKSDNSFSFSSFSRKFEMYFYLKAHCQWTTRGLRTSKSMLSSSSNFEVPINTPLPTTCSPSLRDMKSLSLKTASVTTSFVYETDTSPAWATVTTSLRSDVFVPFHSIPQSFVSRSIWHFRTIAPESAQRFNFGRASTKTAEKSRLPGVNGAEVKAVKQGSICAQRATIWSLRLVFLRTMQASKP